LICKKKWSKETEGVKAGGNRFFGRTRPPTGGAREAAKKRRRKMSLKEIEREIREIKEIQAQFANKDEEIKRLKYEVESLEEEIEKAIIALDQTKKIFKSKTIALIRKELIQALPINIRTKFIGIQPPESWSRLPEDK